MAELDKTGLGIDFIEIKKKLADVLPDHKLSTKFMTSIRRLKIWPERFTHG